MARKESSSSEMRYTCDQPGCSKSYSRPDHLLRHKLNHDQDRVLCCNQCDRTFVRQDLLVRHLERHALRGKTLGRWSNRQKDGSGGDIEPGSSSTHKSISSARLGRKHSASGGARRHSGDLDSEDEDDMDGEDNTGHVNGQAVRPDLAQHRSNQSYSNFSEASGSGWPAFGSGNQSSPSKMRTGTHQSSQASNTGVSWPRSATGASGNNDSIMSPPTHRPANTFTSATTALGLSESLGSGGAYGQNSAVSSTSAQQHAFRNNADWNGSQASQHLLASDQGAATREATSSGSTAAAASGSTPFRWMPPDEAPQDSGAGSYAPPPSAAYFSSWNNATSTGNNTGRGDVHSALAAPLTDIDTATVNSRNPSAFPMPNQDIFPFAPPVMDHTADYGWLFDGVDPFGGSTFGSLSRAGGSVRGPQSQTSGFSPSSSDGLGGFLGNFAGSNSGAMPATNAGDASSFGRGMSSDGVLLSGSEVETPNALEDLAYFATLQADIPARLAYNVDPVAHHRLLIFLQSVSELPNSPLFTPSALRCYIYLFFVKFNRLYPLIHEPTFSASTTDPMLLSAVIVIGAHFAGQPAHDLAVRIAQKIWGAIVSLEDFRPARATLPMLQAMVLTEAFGKMMSTRPQHEMAHLFHNFIVTLARRNAVFNASAVNQSHYENSEDSWRSWAREEEKKRIALFEFMLDAQHATIFRHIPSLSSFQIQLNLPCSDEEWSKTTPEAWYKHRRRTSYKAPTPFIPALKACLSPGKTPQELDAFPRFVLLHGLMSIAYDLQWKQNVLLGAESSPGGTKTETGIGNWKNRLSAAYSSLQARMDIAYIKADEDSSPRLIYRATPSLVTAAQIALFADVIDIQIYAGLPSVLGRFIDRATFNASRRLVKDWARTSDGRTAVWYAVNFLRTSLLGTGTESYGTIQTFRAGGSSSTQHGDRDHIGDDRRNRTGSPPGRKSVSDRESGLDDVLHHRWCQYICALVIWAYGHALATPRSGQATTDTRPSSAHRPGMPQLSELSVPLQGPLPGEVSAAGTHDKSQTRKPEGVEFLERMSTKTADEVASVDCKCFTKGVLEMVEREVRASRWELGREASGVLRKLISNHSMPNWDRSVSEDNGGKQAQAIDPVGIASKPVTELPPAATLQFTSQVKVEGPLDHSRTTSMASSLHATPAGSPPRSVPVNGGASTNRAGDAAPSRIGPHPAGRAPPSPTKVG
ncbi:hypothetical protein BCV70DRAFT_158113 [Testicularia cyperi]|uniref:C2H2-type domain-containing protein n=1 Tax=Testicularia cyperi TaxID=1882483 RepID=A0A317XTV6_9BASI|nr:hypothetical protein BCV70DRAFT_158113 [Testicularia cyperi]